MQKYIKQLEVRWADLDPNFHVLHSKYYDYGATCRMAFLTENGLTTELLMQHSIGPILFKETCEFKREIRFGDKLEVHLEGVSASSNYKKWVMRHQLYTNENTLSAIITLEGSWIDMEKRKIATPPQFVIDVFEAMPKSENFYFIDKA